MVYASSNSVSIKVYMYVYVYVCTVYVQYKCNMFQGAQSLMVLVCMEHRSISINHCS